MMSITVPAWGRLGETGDALIARYGQPLSETDRKAEGGKIPLIELVFQKNGFEIDASISDGVCGEESFKKNNGDELTVLEVRTLLGLNSQGFQWGAPATIDGGRQWTRDDGSMATLTGGHILSIKSKTLADKEMAAQKLDRTPSLDGF
jgi:hypothetical protein